MESGCLSAEGLSSESMAIRLWRDEGASMLTLVVVGVVGGGGIESGRERVEKMEVDRR